MATSSSTQPQSRFHIVIDIGKTNKKVLVFDSGLHVISSVSRAFPEVQRQYTPCNGGGAPAPVDIVCEDVEAVMPWLQERLREAGALCRSASATSHGVGFTVAVTTHGATFAAVGKDVLLPFPVLSYTQQMSEEQNNEFYNLCGTAEVLHATTATPPYGSLLNMAKGMFLAQKIFRDKWEGVKYLIPYSSFFGYWLTGVAACDKTAVGCHTYLWDYQKDCWSSVTKSLGIAHLLPQVKTSVEKLGTLQPSIARLTGLPEDTVVMMGVHDSNASLVPYFSSLGGTNFAVNSSGTWGVIMKPSKSVEFASCDIGELILYNMSVFGKPVRTISFPAGMEFSAVSQAFKTKFDGAADIDFSVPLSGKELSLYQSLIDSNSFLLPGVTGTGIHFWHCKPGFVLEHTTPIFGSSGSSQETIEWPSIPGGTDIVSCMALLRLSVAVQTYEALIRSGVVTTGGSKSANTAVFVEGGFKNDLIYCSLLAALLPHNAVSTSAAPEATALGSALLAHAATATATPEEATQSLCGGGRSPASIDLRSHMQFTTIQPAALTGLPNYGQRMLFWASQRRV
ncbi:carbohydrate kinase [Pelomyxa schiedti]|nr:carbohydrate kinase [Pelomyxa schiedti]